MDGISQNWIWLALAAGAFFFMPRMGGHGMGGYAMGRSMRPGYGGGSDVGRSAGGGGPRTAFDPVSMHAVAAGASMRKTA